MTTVAQIVPAMAITTTAATPNRQSACYRHRAAALASTSVGSGAKRAVANTPPEFDLFLGRRLRRIAEYSVMLADNIFEFIAPTKVLLSGTYPCPSGSTTACHREIAATMFLVSFDMCEPSITLSTER